MGFFPATPAAGSTPAATADPSSLDDTALTRYVRGLLLSVRTNVIQDEEVWSIVLKRRSEPFAPNRAKGTRKEIVHRIARWIALRNGKPSLGDQFEESIGRIVQDLTGKRVEQAGYYAKHKAKVDRKKAAEERRLAAIRAAERKTREKRKLEGRPEIYVEGIRGREIHAWAALHVMKVPKGFIPVEWALKAQAMDVDFGKTPYTDENRKIIMNTVMHSMFGVQPIDIQGAPGWSGVELDDHALLYVFEDAKCTA